MKKKIKIILCVLLITIFLPKNVSAAYVSVTTGGSFSGSHGGAHNSANNVPNYHGSYAYGFRLTVVDNNGNILPGTKSVEFMDSKDINAVGSENICVNRETDGSKKKVMTSKSLKFNCDPFNKLGVYKMQGIRMYMTGSVSGGNLKLYVHSDNGKTDLASYFRSIAKSNTLFNNYISKTGYKKGMGNINKQYVLIEPMTIIEHDNTRYFVTATEIGDTFWHSMYTSVVKKIVGPSMCYTGKFNNSGSITDDNGNKFTMQSGNQLYAYTTSNRLSKDKCLNLETDKQLHQKNSSGRIIGNALGVFYMPNIVESCDINKITDFHKDDGSDDQDYKPTDKTARCCEEMIAQYGQAYVEQRYPICGSCPVKTTSRANACGSKESVVLTDEHNFSCLFKGVSGKNASKYDYSSRKSVRKKYKVGTIGSKYCEVYCIDDIIGQFPGNYEGQVTPGGSLIWPSYNNDYKATLQTTRTCKIRFRQQEWLNAFNKGNSTKKNSLVKALKECAGQNSILAYYDKYIKSLNPTLALSYNNGVTTIGPKNLKLDTKRSTYSKTCNGCNVNTSGLSVSNVVSKLNSIANGITNKILTIKTNLRYVLPDGLYQYADKKTGLPLENYTPGKEINSNGTKNNTKIIDTGSSKLVVDEKAKTDQKYNLTIDYNKLSVVSGKFKNENGKYTCKYTPTTGTCPPGTPDCPSKACDYNEPSHFKDIDGDGKLDSGPNGEDCCEWFANKYGTSSEEYKKLVSRGDCPDPGPDPDPDPDPDCTPGDPDCPYGNSCVYPRDLATPDIAVKNKCCAMILVDKRYSLEERKQYYQQYCTGKPYCPQDCENGKCTDSPMTQRLRNCMATGKSYNECKIDNCPGSGRILIYRPISLIANEAFPGVNKENRIWSNNNWYYYSNWAYRGNSKKRDYYVKEYITNNRGVKEYNIYNLAPMYTIKLDAKAIRSIRNYNKSNSYDDFNLKCTDGRKCKSTYIRQKITGIVSGCGVSSDWYACQGISAERGD